MELYAKHNSGNILIWKVDIVNKHQSCSLSISYGRLFGSMQLEWENNIVPKNVGRSNETTAYEQAESRLKSRVNKKKRGGYRELDEDEKIELEKREQEDLKIEYLKSIISDDRRDLEGFRKPMKAAQYFRSKPNWTAPDGSLWKNRKYYYILNPHKEKEKGAVVAKFPMLIQPKINGVRAFLYLEDGVAKLKSKDGLEYTNTTHINDWANNNKELFGKEGDYILDGELYIYGESLQNIGSAVDKYSLNSSRVVFVCFDIAIERQSNLDRWKMLKLLYNNTTELGSPIHIVNTFIVKNDKQVQKLTDDFIEEGYEGSILRAQEAEYGFGSRKNTMLKLKRVISKDFIIQRIVSQPKKPNLGMFECAYNGVTFSINPTFSEDKKADLINNPSKYIGKKLQTDFYEWTNAGKPFHIVRTLIRDYE